ncbi:MAG: single-stranded DNA-binding protein, partial [Candidatus Omnitrophota bacterium]|nr:single-stranded DNA-binding protein [Candidatus Omnitrophota bacterium]
FIEGRLQYRAWETPNGEKRNTLEVSAERVQFLGRKEKTDDALAGKAQPKQEIADINLDTEPLEPNLGGQVKPGKPDSEVPF